MRNSLPYRNSTLVAFFAVISILAVPLLLPEKVTLPVQGATPHDWNPSHYWECPWCKGDRIHYGIDIIHPEGTPVLAATYGIVIFRGWHGGGGNVIIVLGPRWKTHYYAHLSKYIASPGQWVQAGEPIGLVGNTGASDMPHLHYSIRTLLPRPWQIDGSKRGWEKMFYMNPHEEIMRDYVQQR